MRALSFLVVPTALTCLIAFGPAAQAQKAALDVGDPAPEFEAVADDGTLWRSRDHVGASVLVVYFYPAAMTAGCTAQACSFRDNRSRLQELGAEVVGVSGDQVEGLQIFKRANQLNFPLLSDTAGEIARAFGVPVSAGGRITRTLDGQEVALTREVTAARWTFIVGRDGRIAYRETRVDPAGDGDAVVAALQSLVSERQGAE
jgi:thioredoxin-dependent peroxiredoxin